MGHGGQSRADCGKTESVGRYGVIGKWSRQHNTSSIMKGRLKEWEKASTVEQALEGETELVWQSRVSGGSIALLGSTLAANILSIMKGG